MELVMGQSRKLSVLLTASAVFSTVALSTPIALPTPTPLPADSSIIKVHLCHSTCVQSGAVCHQHGSAPFCSLSSCTCPANAEDQSKASQDLFVIFDADRNGDISQEEFIEGAYMFYD